MIFRIFFYFFKKKNNKKYSFRNQMGGEKTPELRIHVP